MGSRPSNCGKFAQKHQQSISIASRRSSISNGAARGSIRGSSRGVAAAAAAAAMQSPASRSNSLRRCVRTHVLSMAATATPAAAEDVEMPGAAAPANQVRAAQQMSLELLEWPAVCRQVSTIRICFSPSAVLSQNSGSRAPPGTRRTHYIRPCS
jgi:hypothetical protein